MLEPEQIELLDVFALAWEGSRGVEEAPIHGLDQGLQMFTVHFRKKWVVSQRVRATKLCFG